MPLEDLTLSAAQLRESLALSDSVTKDATALLDTCSSRLQDLERTVQPLALNKALRARENIKKARDRAEEVLEHLDASRRVQGIIQEGPRANLQAFLSALSKLESAIEFLKAQKHMATAADALAHTSALRDRAVERAGAEFGALLGKHCHVPPALVALQRQSTAAALALDARQPEADPGLAVSDMLPESVLPKLRALALAMLNNGDRSCLRTYGDARRRVLHQCLDAPLAGVGTRDDIGRLAWRQIVVRIPGWEAAVRLLVVLVQEEARLCAAVLPPAEQAQVLQQITSAAGRALADSGDAIVSSRRLPDKLFGLLDMHDALSWALPSLQSALAAQQHSRLERLSAGMGGAPPPTQPLAVASELKALQGRVGAEVRACFAQLQESYGGQVGAEGVPPEGTVHPMCGSTVAALKQLLSYDSALPVLFGGEEGASGRSTAVAGGGGLKEEARLLERMSTAVATILDSLLTAVEVKAKASYRSRAQVALHMVNNAHFLVRAAEGRELRAVGDSWLEAHKSLVEKYTKEYMEQCWTPLVSLLQADLAQPAPTPAQLERGGRQAAKDKWTAANKILEGVLAQQGSWTVVDATLRYNLKDTILDTVLPLYQAFTERYMGVPFTENRSKYLRFGVTQVHNFVAHDLFEKGSAGGEGLRPAPSGASALLSRMSAAAAGNS